ncbi:MAG TPA: hypothetical protein PK208_15665 [Fibrobacteria bacterium]|nr:hypothetical protein [Fibrobacteria bacterium]
MIAVAAIAALGLAGGAPTDSVIRIDSVEATWTGAGPMRGPVSRLRGEPLDSAAVERRLREAVDSAVAKGFLAASAAAIAARATDSGVALLVEARTGGRLVWDRLRDVGTSRLTPRALGMIGRIPAGMPADPADLESALTRLEMTGYVRRTAPAAIRRVPRTARAEALVSLGDLPSSFLEAAASWTRSDDPKGYAEARLSNIAGTARDLEFGISQGEPGTSAHAKWKEPWVAGFPVRLVLEARLANDSLSSVLEGAVELGWTLFDGRADLGVALSGARRAELAPGDTAFGPTAREFGTRLAVSGRRRPVSIWPVDDFAVDLAVQAVGIESDTGSLSRIRLRGGIDVWRSLGPASARLGAQARSVWPLDRSAGLSEALAPGGIAGWRGWPEGSPRSPSWAWLVVQGGFGGSGGGVFAFWEPGVRALRRQDLSWEPAWGWSAGTGIALQIPSWRIDLVLAARDDTPAWQDALLQVRARNRF